MDKLHSFPKVYAIGHRAVANLFQGPVLVEEKVDGSQFSFGKLSGEMLFRSRGAKLYAENSEKMFATGVNNALAMADRLHDGWVYRCEYLQKPKHNVLAYERVPHHNFILFDINTGDECYLTRDQKEEEAERLGIEIVPVVHQGEVSDPETLLGFLDRTSILGGKVEGIVVKNYAQFGEDKKVLMGKFVSEDFKETHSKEWKANNPTMGDVVERLIATLRSEVRWEKAVNRLRDAGTLESSPRDIGHLIKEVQSDITAEERDFVEQKLAEWAMPRIIRASTAGLPEWYKLRLLNGAFDVEAKP